MKGPIWGIEEAPAAQVADGLRRARRCLAEGWAPWFPRDRDGRMADATGEDACAWPILDAVALFLPDVAARLVAEELLDQAIGGAACVSEWEGALGRTRGEVLAVVDRAVVRAMACARGER